jgi:ATP-dependent Clp protease ATP-binding subunit ClpA
MFNELTDRACKIMKFAQEEAEQLKNDYIDTSHILLGLMDKYSGVASCILDELNVDITKVREKTTIINPPVLQYIIPKKLPLTPNAKKALELAMEEVHKLHDVYIDTEHILLGLLQQGQESSAIYILTDLDVNLEEIRNRTLGLLGKGIQKFGNDNLTFPQTMDAKIWTKEWLKTLQNHPTIATDEGAMLGWFANAIMAGYDAVGRKVSKLSDEELKEEFISNYKSIVEEILVGDK